MCLGLLSNISLSLSPVMQSSLMPSSMASLRSMSIPVGITVLCKACISNCLGFNKNFLGVSRMCSAFLDAIPSL